MPTTIEEHKNLGREDINFPEFCFGIIGSTPVNEQSDMLVYKDEKINSEIHITRQSNLSFPTQFSRDIHLAILKIAWRKNKFQNRLVEISSVEICRELKIQKGGRQNELILNHLDILCGTRIIFIDSFFDKKTNSLKKGRTNLGIFSNYRLTIGGKAYGNGSEEQEFTGYVRLDDEYLKTCLFEANNIIAFDFDLYLSVRGEIAKNLFLFLNKRKFKQKQLTIRMQTLCFEKIGISRQYFNKDFKLRELLKKAHAELIEKKILKIAPTFTKKDGQEYLTYTFPAEAVSENTLKCELPKDTPENTPQEPLPENPLLGIFKPKQAQALQKKYPEEEIQKALDLYKASQNKVENPEAFIQDVLKNPDKYNFQKVDKQKERAQQEERNQEVRKQEEKAKEETKKKEAQKYEAVISWIEENPVEYQKICELALKELEEKNGILWEQLQKAKQKESKEISLMEVAQGLRTFRAMFQKKVRESLSFNFYV